MSTAPPIRPVNLTPFPNGEIGIVWNDGHESFYKGRDLRCSCPCATCVNELTGEKMLQDETVAADIRPRTFRPVGNYGVSIEWTDSHDTGIYTFKRLRELCACPACS
jgi:DUF971 family protein